jgi:hypothetical protein
VPARQHHHPGGADRPADHHRLRQQQDPGAPRGAGRRPPQLELRRRPSSPLDHYWISIWVGRLTIGLSCEGSRRAGFRVCGGGHRLARRGRPTSRRPIRWPMRWWRTSENDAKLAQKLGQLQPFSCIPSGMHGPTCIFWANLKPFSLQGGDGDASRAREAAAEPRGGVAGGLG